MCHYYAAWGGKVGATRGSWSLRGHGSNQQRREQKTDATETHWRQATKTKLRGHGRCADSWVESGFISCPSRLSTSPRDSVIDFIRKLQKCKVERENTQQLLQDRTSKQKHEAVTSHQSCVAIETKSGLIRYYKYRKCISNETLCDWK